MDICQDTVQLRSLRWDCVSSTSRWQLVLPSLDNIQRQHKFNKIHCSAKGDNTCLIVISYNKPVYYKDIADWNLAGRRSKISGIVKYFCLKVDWSSNVYQKRKCVCIFERNLQKTYWPSVQTSESLSPWLRMLRNVPFTPNLYLSQCNEYSDICKIIRQLNHLTPRGFIVMLPFK